MADWESEVSSLDRYSQRTVERSDVWFYKLLTAVLTMLRYGISPVVESRIQLRDDSLFPLRTYKAEYSLRFRR